MLVLAVLWAVVLAAAAPAVPQSAHGRTDSIGDFNYKLGVLGRDQRSSHRRRVAAARRAHDAVAVPHACRVARRRSPRPKRRRDAASSRALGDASRRRAPACPRRSLIALTLALAVRRRSPARLGCPAADRRRRSSRSSGCGPGRATRKPTRDDEGALPAAAAAAAPELALRRSRALRRSSRGPRRRRSRALGAAARDDPRGEAPRPARSRRRRRVRRSSACAASIRATHRGEFDAAAKLAARRAATSPRPTPRSAAIPTCARRVPPRRQEGVRRGEPHARVRARRPAADAEELGVEVRAVPQRAGRSGERAAPPAARLPPRRRARRGRAAARARWTTSTGCSSRSTTPTRVTGGLRRTTDALRGVLERTRGDLTTAIVAARLQGAIEPTRRDAALTPRVGPGALVP